MAEFAEKGNLVGPVFRSFNAKAKWINKIAMVALSSKGMARKCHRQKISTRFNLFGEQFWGRAARASWTRKSFRTLVIFARFSARDG
jgi:hypothetical protein